MNRLIRAGAAIGMVGALAGFTAGDGLTALARLEPGLYQVRALGPERTRAQSICVADPAVLLQLKHRDTPCSRVVIDNGPSGATVHYTCPSSGYGRTSLRVETPRLAKIDTQGLADNAPFAYRAEARRVGACGAGPGRATGGGAAR